MIMMMMMLMFMLDHAGQFAFTGNGMVSGCVAQLCGHIQKTFIFFLPAFLEKKYVAFDFRLLNSLYIKRC